jgi:transcriptional regulator with XRE-family HTH domain
LKQKTREFAREAGIRLKQLRKQLGYSQPEMARHIGVTASGYRKNENGENIPHARVLYQLLNEHNISMDWFLFGKGPRNHAGPKIETQDKKIRELETEVERLKQELDHISGQYEKDKEQLRQLLEQTEGIRDAAPEVREMAIYMKKDPELYHDLLLHFHRNRKDRG